MPAEVKCGCAQEALKKCVEGNNESAFFVRKQEQLANRGGLNYSIH
jgi:hypothetical protein